MVERIDLLPDQIELLKAMVEAQRNAPSGERRKFLLVSTFEGDSLVHHGLPGGERSLYDGDLELLAREGLLTVAYEHGAPNYDVHPLGYRYYEQLQQQADKPVAQVEQEVRRFLDDHEFRRRHPLAAQKWTSAAEKLWSSDSPEEWTTIGHLCREAAQEFADNLVRQSKPQAAPEDPKATVARLRAVLKQQGGRLGKTEKPMLDALLVYWGTVNDLIQRQEHGAQKEGETLIWEDARRVVFQTAIVMFEVDRALTRGV